MNFSEKPTLRQAIIGIIEAAEKQCTDLILEAVRAQDRKGMELAGQVAIRLRDIIETLKHPATASGSHSPAAAKRTETRRKVRKGEYPKFHVEDGCLVKVGWSKKAKEEYVHKMPQETYEGLLEIISRRAAESSKEFTAEEILQATDQLAEPVPNYHVYIALGFLQARGILEKHGRSGYIVREEVNKAGLAAWQDLAREKDRTTA